MMKLLQLKTRRKIAAGWLTAILGAGVLATPNFAPIEAARTNRIQVVAAEKSAFNGDIPRTEARLIVRVNYVESDVTETHTKDSGKEETSSTETRTVVNFAVSQKGVYYTDSEGEEFTLTEDAVPLGGTYTKTYKERSRYTDDGRFVSSSFTNGSASGVITRGNPSITIRRRGLSIGASGSFKMQTQCSGEIKSSFGITPNNGCLLPESGSSESFDANAKPDLPPPSPDEDFNLAIERQALENPAIVFGSNGGYGTKTSRSKNVFTATFQASREDPDDAEKAKESTPENQVKRVHTKQISISGMLVIGKPEPAEMEIEPEKPADYDKWMPVPAADGDDKIAGLYGDGSAVSFKIKFKSKDPKKPQPPEAPMDFYLQDVSRHKGRSGNEGDEEDKPDLRFAKNQPGGVKLDPNDPLHAYIESNTSEAIVAVEATDAGAYGKLVVRSDALGATAIYKRTGANFIAIPRDDNENHVADDWEKKGNTPSIFDKNYPATWDEEDTPQTHSKGDGLTLYEEYRGFILDVPTGDGKYARAWQRLGSNRKKLFINLIGNDKELFRQGAKNFQKASGIQVYFMNSIDDLKQDENHRPRVQLADNSDPKSPVPLIIYPQLLPRWLNFNSDTDDGKDFGGRQYAVNITNWKLPVEPTVHARTPGIEGVGDKESAPPELTQAVYVFRENNENIIAKFADDEFPRGHPEKIDKTWYPVRDKVAQQYGVNIDLNKMHDVINSNYAELVNRAIIFSVMHELGHATGMFHHTSQDFYASGADYNPSTGDSDCPMFYWDDDKVAEFQLLFYSGNWNPAEHAASGKDWKFDNGKDCLQSCRLHKDKQK